MSFKTRFAAIVAALALSASFHAAPAKAQVDPFLGQVMLVGYNFCPRGWIKADGQLIAISSNPALFSLFGTFYGGDGRTTFALPDLRGRVALNYGQGPGLSHITIGQKGGVERRNMTVGQMPAHSHAATTTVTADVKARGTSSLADKATPVNNVPARTGSNAASYHAGPADQDMNTSAIQANITASTANANTGGNQQFDVRNPFLGMTWCVATVGIFPSRN